MSPGRRFINALIGTAEREARIDVAKAAVLREMAAIDEQAAGVVQDGRFEFYAGDAFELEARRVTVERRRLDERKRKLHALLEDDDALLAWAQRKAGALSVADTAGGELSEAGS